MDWTLLSRDDGFTFGFPLTRTDHPVSMGPSPCSTTQDSDRSTTLSPVRPCGAKHSYSLQLPRIGLGFCLFFHSLSYFASFLFSIVFFSFLLFNPPSRGPMAVAAWHFNTQPYQSYRPRLVHGGLKLNSNASIPLASTSSVPLCLKPSQYCASGLAAFCTRERSTRNFKKKKKEKRGKEEKRKRRRKKKGRKDTSCRPSDTVDSI